MTIHTLISSTHHIDCSYSLGSIVLVVIIFYMVVSLSTRHDDNDNDCVVDDDDDDDDEQEDDEYITIDQTEFIIIIICHDIEVCVTLIYIGMIYNRYDDYSSIYTIMDSSSSSNPYPFLSSSHGTTELYYMQKYRYIIVLIQSMNEASISFFLNIYLSVD